MHRRSFLALSILAPLAWSPGGSASVAVGHPRVPDGRPHRFGFAKRKFLLDGRPFTIRSGEMHPQRIAKGQWRERILTARAMGLNTIALYVMWNALEQTPGVFDFSSDNRDVIGFIKLCQAEGMWVYLRPGPYVCGEWSNGGLPAYLLRDPDIRLRAADDPRYMAAVRRYIAALAPRIAPLMACHGGPILLLQVENEYSMYGVNVGYLEAIEALWREHGIAGPFAIADGWDDLQRRKAYLPGAALGLDGPDSSVLAAASAFAGEAPVWVSEGYPGWITHWGDARFSSKDYAATLRSVMRAGYSFNLYVVHGGTNFGLSAGANAADDGSEFQPALTSYDYGAPIDEAGRVTPAWYALRAAITEDTAVPPPAPPPAPAMAHFDAVSLTPYASLWDNLSTPSLRLLESGSNEILFGQDQGLVVYRKQIGHGRTLRLEKVRDYAVAYVNGAEIGHISRLVHPRLHSAPVLNLPGTGTRQLEILLDTFGHINFGPQLGDRKGLIGPVTLDGDALTDIEAWPLPLDGAWLEALKPLQKPPSRGGVFFRGSIRLAQTGSVYMDMSDWSKGYLWVNGHLLGRYWNIGPQQHLYCPQPWLHVGDNTVQVLDLHQTRPALVRCSDHLHRVTSV